MWTVIYSRMEGIDIYDKILWELALLVASFMPTLRGGRPARRIAPLQE
jgi:hypothetical protein